MTVLPTPAPPRRSIEECIALLPVCGGICGTRRNNHFQEPEASRTELGVLRRLGKGRAISARHHDGITPLARVLIQGLIKRNKRGLQGVRGGEEPTVADPFGGRPGPERLGDAAKLCVRISRLGVEIDPRIGKPPVVYAPCLTEGQRLLTHDGLIGQQAE